MFKKVGTAILLAALFPSASAHAQAYGHYTGAETVPMGGHLFGGYVQVSEGFLGLSGQLRLSFYPSVDFGFQGGLTRTDASPGNEVTTLRVGTDLKVQVSMAQDYDMALGGALGVETGDNIHLLTVGPTFTLSRGFGNPAGAGVTPYAGVGLLFTDADILDQQSTDLAIPFRFGAEFRLSPEIRLVGEVQLRASDPYTDGVSIVTGVNLPF